MVRTVSEKKNVETLGEEMKIEMSYIRYLLEVFKVCETHLIRLTGLVEKLKN